MGRIIFGTAIDSVLVLDDDEASRNAVVDTVADGDVVAVPMVGPVTTDLDATMDQVVRTANALVSDHHLTSFASFDGARAVAAAYKRNFPAVLCSAWAQAKADEIRKYRKWIPSIIYSADAKDPEAFFRGFELCLQEFAGQFSQARKAWRMQLRVEEEKLGDATPVVYVVLLGWSASTVIKLLASDVPAAVQAKIRAGTERFHVMANKGADDADELYFDWLPT